MKTQTKKAAGATMVEVMMALTVLAIATTGVLITVLSNSRLTQSNQEFLTAANAARKTLMEMAGSGELKDIYARYNTSTADNIAPPDDVNPGSTFVVAGLTPIGGQPQCGSIVFPVVGGALREDGNDPQLGMPLDLDGNGAIDAADHSGDYKILPVTVSVQWLGFDGQNHRYDLRMLLSDK